jgi:uridine kinase
VPELPDLSRPGVVRQLAALVDGLPLPARVAVDGPDAAGKTTLADELAAAIGPDVSRIEADRFLRPAAERYRRGRESPEGYYLDSFDDRALRAAVERAEGPAIVDGIFLFRPQLDDLWSFRIFISVSPEESLRRGVARDGEETERLYRVRYLPGQRLYQVSVRPKDRADVVVDNEDPARPSILVCEGVRLPGA